MSTSFRLILPRQLYTEMVAQAQAELPNECCGLLAGHIDQTDQGYVGHVLRCFPLVNEAASPREFLSYPIAATKACRDEGIQFLAIYHSHPTSRPVPSSIDLAQNYYPDVMNLIISLATAVPEVRAWWLSTAGYTEADMEISQP